MARRDPLEERWAGYAIDAAKAWGQPGQMVHDRKRHVVALTGLGDVPLDDRASASCAAVQSGWER